MDEEIQNTMDIEDEIIAELADKERRIGDLIDSINQKDTEIGQKDQALNEKDKLIEELKRKLGE